MNQMAQKNAQVGSDGGSIFPTFSYNPNTNQYMMDSSAFGLTGDAANTYYSPEAFQTKYAKTLGQMPSSGMGNSPSGSDSNVPQDRNPFSFTQGTTVYGDYDPATNTMLSQTGGVAGMMNNGRVSVADLMNPDNVFQSGGSDDPFAPISALGTYYNEDFTNAFNNYYPNYNLGQTGQDVPPIGTSEQSGGGAYYGGGSGTVPYQPTGGGIDYDMPYYSDNSNTYSDPNLGQPNPYQANVNFMNQMAQKNAQVGSDGSSLFPTFSYNPNTNQYMQDSSAFGLTGDAANTYFSPEEFQSKFGKTLGQMSSQSGGLFSDPNLEQTGQGGGGLDYSGMSPSTGGLDTGMALAGLGSLFTGGSLQDILGSFGQYSGGKEGIEAAYGTGEAGLKLAEQVGQRAADTSQFKPYTVTSNLAQVQTDPTGGYNLNLSPQQQALQNQALGQAGQFLGQTGSYDPSIAAQRGAMGGLFGQSLGQYGQPTGLEGLTQAGISGAQRQLGRAGQPSDINQLRNQFAGQVGGYLGQQPDAGIGALGQQALRLGSQGLGRFGQGQEGFGNLQGLLTSQAGSRLQQPVTTAPTDVSRQAYGLGSQGLQNIAPDPTLSGLQQQVGTRASDLLSQTASTLPSQVASQVYGLGMQGLQDRTAPTDIEALRSQYAGLALQAGQGLLSTPEQRQADIYESIRATQTPEEQRQRLALEERLLAQGRTGVSSAAYGGASPELLAMETARQEAMARAGLSARQQAMAEQQQGLATAQSLTGLTTGLAGTSSDLQSAAQSRASQLTQLGLSADQIQSQLESEGLSRGLQATQTTGQTAGMLSDLQSSAQARATQLTQLGLSADQVQSQLQSEGLSRGLQTTQAAGQMAGIRSDLDSASQARATQLSQLGLSAEQIESRLRSEGLSRATTAGTTAGQLAGIASDLETAGIGRGTALANLGLTGTQASNTMRRQQLEDIMNLQRSDISSAQIQQALQQGRLGLGTGMLQAGYTPQNQALEMLRQSQVPAQFASAGRLQGADLQAQLGTAGVESLMQGSQLANELRQQQLNAALQATLGAQNPTTGSFEDGIIGSILKYLMPNKYDPYVFEDVDYEDDYGDYYDYDGGE